MDLVTADAGTSSEAKPFAEGISLFVQYRDAEGKLKLRRDHVITLPDGSSGHQCALPASVPDDRA